MEHGQISRLHAIWFDNAHPVVTGAVLSNVLPWDHVTNLLWSVAGSVFSWAPIQVVTRLWPKKAVRPGQPTADSE